MSLEQGVAFVKVLTQIKSVTLPTNSARQILEMYLKFYKLWPFSLNTSPAFTWQLQVFPHITTDSQSLTEVYHFIGTQLLVLKL